MTVTNQVSPRWVHSQTSCNHSYFFSRSFLQRRLLQRHPGHFTRMATTTMFITLAFTQHMLMSAAGRTTIARYAPIPEIEPRSPSSSFIWFSRLHINHRTRRSQMRNAQNPLYRDPTELIDHIASYLNSPDIFYLAHACQKTMHVSAVTSSGSARCTLLRTA